MDAVLLGATPQLSQTVSGIYSPPVSDSWLSNSFLPWIVASNRYLFASDRRCAQRTVSP
jgi:hypothetical protein